MRNWLWIAFALVLTLPALLLKLSGAHVSPGTEALVFGLGIFGGAFLIAWGCEAAQVEVSQGLALAFLALIAVLPEYAVDGVLAWKAARNPDYAHYAIANMTGANRLLIGIGWSLVVLLFWLKTRRKEVELKHTQSVELSFLLIATLYVFIIPLKGNISLWDSLFLVPLFALYVYILSRGAVEPPHLIGPAAAVCALPSLPRRLLTLFLFIFPGGVILASADPFAEGLIATGKAFGIDEFLLVQWVAPLASEAPEITVAIIFTLMGNPAAGLGALVASKVNQWTLLIGTLPVVYSVSLGAPGALPLDARQTEEVLLTAAQSAFAVAVISDLRLGRGEALALLVLFTTQLALPDPTVRYIFSGLYLGLTAFLLLSRGRLKAVYLMVRDTFGQLRPANRP